MKKARCETKNKKRMPPGVDGPVAVKGVLGRRGNAGRAISGQFTDGGARFGGRSRCWPVPKPPKVTGGARPQYLRHREIRSPACGSRLVIATNIWNSIEAQATTSSRCRLE